MSFADQVVIVAGASSSIGAQTALLFTKEGASVAIVTRTKPNPDAVATQVEAHGKKPLIIAADLSKETDVDIIPKTIEHFGKIDVLVNNAGITAAGSILNGNALPTYDSVMKTNVRSAIQLTTAPYLVRTKGNIVNISSVLGASVNSTTSRRQHFTRCAARELAPKGARVKNVSPGPVDNEFRVNNGMGDKNDNTHILVVALDYLATNEDIGDAILFVASAKTRKVTGSTYYVENGYLSVN